jgi:hypothetical protein
VGRAFVISGVAPPTNTGFTTFTAFGDHDYRNRLSRKRHQPQSTFCDFVQPGRSEGGETG